MGVTILIGIVVNNGIVMVEHVNNLRREGMDRVPAMIQGCGDRLRPVLMTAITTIVGLSPLAMSAFMVVDVYIDSLAVVVIGGLATSTIFTLLALPVWYTTLEDLGSVLWRAMPRRACTTRRASDGSRPSSADFSPPAASPTRGRRWTSRESTTAFTAPSQTRPPKTSPAAAAGKATTL